MYDPKQIADLVSCVNGLSQSSKITAHSLVSSCDSELHLLAYHGAIDALVVPSVTALALFAFSVSAGYVSLPNYRYRQNLTDYLGFRLVRALGSLDDASKWLQKQKKEHSGAVLDAKKKGNEEPEQSTYIRFALLVLSMPRGEANGDRLTKTECDGVEFFDDPSGWLYRKLFENHFDNTLCQILAAIMAMIAVVGTVDLLGFDLIDLSLAHTLKLKFLLAVIIAGIIVPPSFAGLGRSIVCRNARKAIDRCVKNIQSHIKRETTDDIKGELERVRNEKIENRQDVVQIPPAVAVEDIPDN